MQTKRYLKGEQVDRRYSISNKTRKNWVARGILPAPVVIHNREYYDEDLLDALDRERVKKHQQRAGVTGNGSSTAQGAA